jgi:hypothetical protein
MLGAMSNAQEQTKRMAILCASAFLALNAAFYVLSDSYFDSHRQLVAGVSVPSYSPEQITHVRTMFAVFSGVVAACGFAAGIWTRVTGHLVPLLLGACYLVSSISLFRSDAPGVLWVVAFVLGVVMPVLAWSSYRHRSRAAWAFLVTICGVLAVSQFFGAPKIARGLDLSLWLAMILPGLEAVAAAALVSLRAEYVDREP